MIRKSHAYRAENREFVRIDMKQGAIRTSHLHVGDIIVSNENTLCALITCGRDFAFEAKDLRMIADALENFEKGGLI